MKNSIRGRSDCRAVKTCEEHGTVGPPGSRSTVLREANPVRSSLNSTNPSVCSTLLSTGRKYNKSVVLVVNMSGLQRTVRGKLGPQSDTNILQPQEAVPNVFTAPAGGAQLMFGLFFCICFTIPLFIYFFTSVRS